MLELVFLESQPPAPAAGADAKQIKTCSKSVFLALKSFLQARPSIGVKVWIQESANKHAEQWIETWIPRRVKVEVGKDVDTLIRGLGATSIVVLVDPLTLLTPDSILMVYDTLSTLPLNSWLSLVDTTTPDASAVELRALGSRHWKTVTTNVAPVPAASRGVTLQTDFDAWTDVAKQPTLALLNNRLVLSPIPSFALRLGAAPPPAVPWDRVAQMIETAT